MTENNAGVSILSQRIRSREMIIMSKSAIALNIHIFMGPDTET